MPDDLADILRHYYGDADPLGTDTGGWSRRHLEHTDLVNALAQPSPTTNAMAPQSPYENAMGQARGLQRGLLDFNPVEVALAMAMGPRARVPMPGATRHIVRGSAMDYPESIPGHAYRGMEAAEYNATVGAGQPVWSRRDYSHSSEGTKFGDDFGTAESYANFGRSDPRTTGSPNYVVEVHAGRLTRDPRDGYLQAREPVPVDDIRRVWRIDPQDGSLVASPIEWSAKR